MKTVNEVSRLTGVSIRTLHYYDQIGLLHPTDITQSGYRLYDYAALKRLQEILLFRELKFPLKEITEIVSSVNFNRQKAIEQQIELLKLKKEHLESLISFAKELSEGGEKNMDFSAFDTRNIDEYTKRAKAQWGNTTAFKEFEEKTKGKSKQELGMKNQGLMVLFKEFGTMMEQEPEASVVQEQVKKLQDFISANYYQCTKEILSGLGQMYSDSPEFKENIDNTGGQGCAEFASKAIAFYCK